MIQRPTVLILGAGASKPYGFPLAGELREQILDGLADDDRPLARAITAIEPTHQQDVRDFFNKLRLSDAPSVDAFLEGNKPQYVDIGRLAIAGQLLTQDYGDNRFFPVDIRRHWYRFLWNRLHDEASVERLADNQVSVITFNYDLTLEYYLEAVIENKYNLTRDAAVKLRRAAVPDLTRDAAVKLRRAAVPVIHLHGELRGTPRASQPPDKLSAGVIRKTADQISIVHDPLAAHNERFERAREVISKAEVVCFLGFAFHASNVRRLQLSESLPTHIPVYGSTFGLLAGQEGIAKRLVRENGNVVVHSDDAETFLKRFEVLV
jgi:hypothetical protein